MERRDRLFGIKRTFSNSVRAVKMKNITHEIKLKIAVYNRPLYMAQEMILKVQRSRMVNKVPVPNE